MSGLGSLKTGDGTERSAAELFGSAGTGQAGTAGRASGLGSALGGRRKSGAARPNGASQSSGQGTSAEAGAVAVWTGNEASAFSTGRMLTAADIVGTPREQLEFVTAHLREISKLGSAAEDYVVLTKGVLLEAARERELHKEAQAANFAQWAAGVLDIAEKYVFELLKDAQRIRALGRLRPELREQLTQASARKVIAEVIGRSDVDRAELVIEEGQREAAREGKQRPTAAMLAAIARTLTDKKVIPAQSDGDSREEATPEAATTVAPQLLPLSRAADEVRERAYKPLAPAAVEAAAETDPDALASYLDNLETEVVRVQTRIAAARRMLPVDAEVVE